MYSSSAKFKFERVVTKRKKRRGRSAFPIAELFVQRNETRDCASPVDDDAR